MKKRFFLTALAVCLALCLAFTSAPALADFGDFSGSSDFDFGSSYDSGSDYDYDSWEDDDDDWDSSSDTVIFTGGSGGGDDSGSSGSVLIIAAIIVIVIIISSRKKKGKGGAPVTPVNNAPKISLQPIEEFEAIDPAFDRGAFTQKLGNLYVQMQNGWTAKDIEGLRPYFTDTLFAQMNRQLEAYRNQGRTNYVERIAVMNVSVLGFYQSGGEDHIAAQLQTRIVDYTLDDATGEVISGDRNTEKFMTYEWELSRPTGKTTGEAEERTALNCPNCGAPLEINQSAKCPYCDSVITVDEHDWVIVSMRGVSQHSA